MGVLDRVIASTVPTLPRSAVHLVAKRYIAGSALADAVACVAALNRDGASATIDVLGENATDAAAADRTRDAYVDVLRAIAEHRLDANVSVKPSALGLKTDPAGCEQRLATLCEEARDVPGGFVRIDMEDSSLTQVTLDVYGRLRRRFEHVGPVLQAYLRRTIDDARRLGGKKLNVRLCKGIYVEPAPVAWKDREVVRRNFTWVLETLLGSGATVGVATHDELLVWDALRLKDDLKVPDERFELQMLLGVEEELRRILLDAGHRLRVYVPFGEQWYEYSVRRLRENPEIAGHVTRATVGRIAAKVRGGD